MYGWRRRIGSAGIWRATMFMLLSGILAGCAQDRGFETVPADRAVVPHRPPQPDPEGTALLGDADRQLPIPARKPPSETLLASRPDLNPERLIGLSLVETEALLGEPALQDEKPPAKVWTYNAESCVLSIFFYADISTRDFRALTYEIRTEEEARHEAAAVGAEGQAVPQNGGGRSEIRDRKCLAELIYEHAA